MRRQEQAPIAVRVPAVRDAYPTAECPAGVLFITAGVDVQKDRLVYEVVGWGRGKCSWSIDAGEHWEFDTPRARWSVLGKERSRS